MKLIHLNKKLEIPQKEIIECIMNSQNSIEAFDKLMVKYAIKCNRNNVIAWAEKSPKNCYHYHRLLSEDQSIKFISIIRNGLDVTTSIYPNTEGYFCSILRYNDSMRAVFNFNSPNHYIVRYEDLILDIEKTLMKLFNFLEIEFNEKVLENYFLETSTRDYSKVNHDKIRLKIKKDWIGRYADPEHRSRVNEFLNNEEAMYWLYKSGYRLDEGKLVIEDFNNDSNVSFNEERS